MLVMYTKQLNAALDFVGLLLLFNFCSEIFLEELFQVGIELIYARHYQKMDSHRTYM